MGTGGTSRGTSRKLWQKCRTAAGAMGLRPLTLVLPLVICGVLLGVGLFGILQAAHSQRDQARTKASYLEQIVANSMLAGLQALAAPTNVLAFTALSPGGTSHDEWCRAAAAGTTYLPSGMQSGVRVTWVAPLGVSSQICGDAAYGPPVGTDLLSADPLIKQAIDPEARQLATGWGQDGLHLGPHVYVRGPYPANGTQSPYMVIGRTVFRPRNASDTAGYWDWATPDDTGECVTPDDPSCGLDRFWGIVGVTVSLESLLAASELMSINTGSYTWALTMPTSLASHATPWPTSNSSMQPMPPHMILTSVDVAKKGSGYDFSNAWALYNEGVRSSHSGLEDPVTRDIPMQQQSWQMEMSPLAGWQPNWVTKVVVLIVIIGVALPVLLLSVLASRDQIAQQRAMLNTLLPRNVVKKLWEEHEVYVKRARKLDSAWIELGTPAATMLEVATGLLAGDLPSMQDVLLVRTAILHAWDLYTPVGGWLKDQMAGDMDSEVMDNLAHTLGMAASDRGTVATPAGLARARNMLRHYQHSEGEGEGGRYQLQHASTTNTETDAGDPEEVMAMLQGLMAMRSTHQPLPSQPGYNPLFEPGGQQDLGGALAVTADSNCVMGHSPGGSISQLQGVRPSQPSERFLKKMPMSLGAKATLAPTGPERGTSGGGAGPMQAQGANTEPASTGSGVCNAPASPVSPVPKTPLPFLAPMSFAQQGRMGARPQSPQLSREVSGQFTRQATSLSSQAFVQGRLQREGSGTEALPSPSAQQSPGMGQLGQGVLPNQAAGAQLSGQLSQGASPMQQSFEFAATSCEDSGALNIKSSLTEGDRDGGIAEISAVNCVITGGPDQVDLVEGDSPQGLKPVAVCEPDVRLATKFQVLFQQGTVGDEPTQRLKLPRAAGAKGTSGSELAANGGGGGAGKEGSQHAFRVVRPAAPLMEEVERLLAAAATSWTFDAFALDEATCGHPLSTLAYYLLAKETRLLTTWKLSPTNTARYLRMIECGYKSNPYHNAIHAADVLQTMHVILLHSGMIPHYVDPLTHLAIYLSAVIHDYEHVGSTNDYLINSGHPLAMLYNDRSPMENHHAAAALTLMVRPDIDLPASLDKVERDKLRKMIIELVLGTDMKQHLSITSRFTTVHRIDAHNSPSPGQGNLESGSRGNKPRLAAGSMDPDQSHHSNPGAGIAAVTPLDETERLLSLQMALKCADIGHIVESLETHKKWVSALEEEFFLQGDAERAAGLPISPLFDRTKPGVTKSQPGFFEFVVIPLFKSFTTIFPGCQPLMTQLEANHQYWKALTPSPPVSTNASTPTPGSPPTPTTTAAEKQATTPPAPGSAALAAK